MNSKQVPLSTIKALKNELNDLNSNLMEGFKIDVDSMENILTWKVAIFGPPMTLYEGGYFKAYLEFPTDYPYTPPSIRFISEMFHPNIYPNGEVCISILHGTNVDDGESASLRWNPTQNVSVISLLNEPNINSPANIDASVSYRRWKERGDNEYAAKVKSLTELTYKDAELDGVVVPRSVTEYCVSGRPSHRDSLTYLEIPEDFDYSYNEEDIFSDDEECDNEVNIPRPSMT